MSYGPVHANLEVFEDTATTTPATNTFTRKSRRVIIINDDATNDLLVGIQPTSTPITLKASEVVTFEMFLRSVTVTASTGTVDYRMWVFG